jgi:hypothetical protein
MPFFFVAYLLFVLVTCIHGAVWSGPDGSSTHRGSTLTSDVPAGKLCPIWSVSFGALTSPIQWDSASETVIISNATGVFGVAMFSGDVKWVWSGWSGSALPTVVALGEKPVNGSSLVFVAWSSGPASIRDTFIALRAESGAEYGTSASVCPVPSRTTQVNPYPPPMTMPIAATVNGDSILAVRKTYTAGGL